MPKKIIEYQFLRLLRKYINEIKRGKHLQKNGKRIKKNSIECHLALEKHLNDFCLKKQFTLRLRITDRLTRKQFEDEKKYWKNFYLAFTGYMYDDLGNFDNTVGRRIKLVRAFFNYLNNEKGLNVGQFHKAFFVPAEETEIVVVSPERLKYLIYSEELKQKLSPVLQKTKDVFVFGCSVGLRYSDLIKLAPHNIETINGNTYIKTLSDKTQTFTRTKLPPFACQIIEKYKSKKNKHILPWFNLVALNVHVKRIAEIAGWTEPIQKTRHKRGTPHIIEKTKGEKHYRFCDLITTHTMRRTTITNLLSLGMQEHMVRKISGHAVNSKDFGRYVSFAQNYLDAEIDLVHEKMANKLELQY